MSTTPNRSSTATRRTRSASACTTASPQLRPHRESESQTNYFQRLFTDEDELLLLQSFFKHTDPATSTSNSSSQPPTIDSPTLDHIETSLGLRFNHTQIVDKLRRLRLKYHKLARTKSLIKTTHDREIYEVSRKIWGKRFSEKNDSNSKPKTKKKKLENLETPGDDVWRARKSPRKAKQSRKTIEIREEALGPGEEDVRLARRSVKIEEETPADVDLEKFPALVSELSRCFSENWGWRKGLMCLGEKKLKELNQKWMLLKVEEAEVKARRADLIQKHIKVIVHAVASSDKTD